MVICLLLETTRHIPLYFADLQLKKEHLLKVPLEYSLIFSKGFLYSLLRNQLSILENRL